MYNWNYNSKLDRFNNIAQGTPIGQENMDSALWKKLFLIEPGPDCYDGATKSGHKTSTKMGTWKGVWVIGQLCWNFVSLFNEMFQ